MSDEPPNLVLNLLRIIRSELAEHRTLLVGLVDQGQRIERRMSELDRRFGELGQRLIETRDDIELMLKAEIMGRLGNFETRIEARLDALSEPKA
jgi:CRP-like cAMP-binding protein